MGNVCSSGGKKKDADNISAKSEESPSYQYAKKKQSENKKCSTNCKEAPLVDPEPISDISTGQNISLATNSPSNGNTNKGQVAKIQSNTASDSVSSTPQTITAPCEIPTISSLPHSLEILRGKPMNSRRYEKDRKIVLYVLASDGDHKLERSILYNIYENFKEKYKCYGFEVIISDPYLNHSEKCETTILDVRKWINFPLEAQGGHEIAANSLIEISRHSNSYIIPILFLGSSLGIPLIPLTIESQDFISALSTTDNIKKSLIEKWYSLDNIAQPPCYRLNTKNITANFEEINNEVTELLINLLEIFSKELRDSYLTTLVEQQINNTVLINQELAKRCIWIQIGSIPFKLNENALLLEIETNRRLSNIYNDLKLQIQEKNIIRIPSTIQLQEDQLTKIMENLLTSVIDSIVEEHSNKYSIPYCTFGVDKYLLYELEDVCQYSKVLSQNCVDLTTMEKLKMYITGNMRSPLILQGPSGCGKSTLIAKFMYTLHSWQPECFLILRYIGLSDLIFDNTSLTGSIADQLHFLVYGKPCRSNHCIDSYVNTIKTCLSEAKQNIIIIIDSLDQIEQLEKISWLTEEMPANIKLILTIANDSKQGQWLIDEFKKQNISEENFIQIPTFSNEQWNDILTNGGGEFYTSNGVFQLPEKWKTEAEKIPLQAKLLWWLAWMGNYNIEDNSLKTIIIKVFETIESIFSEKIVGFIFSILVASKHGLLESDILVLLQNSNLLLGPAVSRIWARFCWFLGPLLYQSNKIKVMDKQLILAATQRYSTNVSNAYILLCDYFKEQSQIFVGKQGDLERYNIEKLILLPYLSLVVDKNAGNIQSLTNSIYLTDIQWIYKKLHATGSVQILSDISFVESILKLENKTLSHYKHLKFLKNFLKLRIREINYDANQFFPLFKIYIIKEINTISETDCNDILQSWEKFLTVVNTTHLEQLNEFAFKNIENTDSNKIKEFDCIVNLEDEGIFVACISTAKEEITVWNVSSCKIIRTLKGVPHPSSLIPVGKYGAAVLCKREIKVIDLNEGKFKVTLKGVMNQKMPYFGLHDSKHLVCLSRNRMYVNLMNLESGDCVTTFKAGEDRFLNSLLVSGDGRILVCGDETQKPFPLLVWHLSQRKLLYDLRIPHHDFVTSLSAITHEGSYVCVVAKELNEPTPNFIVVYDLQSGTLFKKWKPSCNTVSLAISQTNACVIAGLDDARILVWDLVTGNCRSTLIGHNAPVTLLKLDPHGLVLLSGDKDGLDVSIRLWELDKGKCLAVYTPPERITACEILSNGKYVIIAVENCENLVTLTLRNFRNDNTISCHEESMNVYGNSENEGKIFEL